MDRDEYAGLQIHDKVPSFQQRYIIILKWVSIY